MAVAKDKEELVPINTARSAETNTGWIVFRDRVGVGVGGGVLSFGSDDIKAIPVCRQNDSDAI